MHHPWRNVFLFGWVTVLACSALEGRSQPATPTPSTSPPVVEPAAEKPAEPVAAPKDGAAATPGQPEADAAAKEAAAKQAEEQKRQQRIQRIQQTQFDRRPSAILKAWSEEHREVEAKPADATPQPAPAQPMVRPGRNRPPGQPTPAAPNDEIQIEIDRLARNVTLGKWTDVASYVKGLSEEDGKTVYRHILMSLSNVPQNPSPAMMMRGQVVHMGGNGQQFMERHAFAFEDIIGLAEACPMELDESIIGPLATITTLTLQAGRNVDRLLTLLTKHFEEKEEGEKLDRKHAARLLVAANQPMHITPFLPTLDEATNGKDAESLNLWAHHLLALHGKDGKLADLEKAWEVTQTILALEEASTEQKQEALRRAVDLAPRVREDLGQIWLDESFTLHVDRGRELLASIGSLSSINRAAQAGNPRGRLRGLEFQRTVVEALIRRVPELADEWTPSLTLLALNWIGEAELSIRMDQSTAGGPMMQRDMYGNIFYSSDPEQQQVMMMNQQGVAPIQTTEMLKIRPSNEWLARVDPALTPKLHDTLAQLLLKNKEEDAALVHIEKLAASHKEAARNLMDEFLRLWTENHDPNTARNRRNQYIWFYGYEQRADGIPLTRSKQERNLVELADVVKRLRALDLGPINENLLTRAFTTCHSSAEVYRLDAIETVFGSLDGLKPITLASLIGQMRGNLASVWRTPAVQEQAKTNRRQKDIEAEVVRGYQVAMEVVDRALTKSPKEWSLMLAKAALLHDHNDYRQELAKSTDYAPARRAALEQFKLAADLYKESVATLPEEERTTEAYDLWFHASLGGCDLGQITEESRPALEQFTLIRQAMESLPGEAASWHMASFANALFTRMSSAKPAIKVRYLKAGFEIVGDHERASEAKKVFDYYNDLVTEIKLEAAIDGPDVVGHTRPFGVFVNLVHTKEIEREAGGFQKYLQNQNSGRGFYYNYGRPLEDYRDKFQNAVNQSLGEHFEVLSVTFNREEATSKAAGEYGWRVTPYCYLLLKARGPQVDRLPSLQMDLDFLDTSGYAVIPIASPSVPLDAKPAKAEARPATNIKVTQTLDERQSKDGKLILEIKATAHGLVPEVDQLVNVSSSGFVVDGIDDQGVSVVEYPKDSNETTIASERLWQVTLRAPEELEKRPSEFAFPASARDDMEMVYQRYQDADLVPATAVASLEQKYGEPSRQWIWWAVLGIVGVVAILLALSLASRRRRGSVVAHAPYHIPEPLTAFSLLSLLRAIGANGLAESDKRELAGAIEKVERLYFAPSEGPQPDLHDIAQTWVERTRR